MNTGIAFSTQNLVDLTDKEIDRTIAELLAIAQIRTERTINDTSVELSVERNGVLDVLQAYLEERSKRANG